VVIGVLVAEGEDMFLVGFGEKGELVFGFHDFLHFKGFGLVALKPG
jgi:hypothetical protein